MTILINEQLEKEGEMLNTMKEFMVKMFQVPVGWRIWLATLMAANMVAPLFFINRIEAQAAFVAINVGAFTGAFLYKQQGFTRLLGLPPTRPDFGRGFFFSTRISENAVRCAVHA